MRLIPNAKDWHKLWSMRLMLLGLLLEAANQAAGLLPSLPPEFRAFLPPWLPIVCFALATVARVIRQERLDAQRH